MAEKEFRAHIKNRELEVHVGVPPGLLNRGEYELAFLGKESERVVFVEHKIKDQVIGMWEINKDPEGSEAEKVFNVTVQLLNKGTPLDVVYKKIEWLINQIDFEESKIDYLIKQVL
jgi:hypothetical protein